MPLFRFELLATDPETGARAGLWHTPHGTIETPTFMPVATRGTAKTMTATQLRATGAKKILGNTYHLFLRPGDEVIERLGGLHAFMDWDGPILTDSGGFQVFSLSAQRKIDDHSVRFRSHIDGTEFEFTPERATQVQNRLGADCIMCLDECPPSTVSRAEMLQAVDRTTGWARRCKETHDAGPAAGRQALFGIVQGGVDREMRERSAEALVAMDFPGYAIGGLSVGESSEEMDAAVGWTEPILPPEKPRYLMGVGRPRDLVESVCRGVDLFDCVMPTRNARGSAAFTSGGIVKMRNLKHAEDASPLDPQCDCECCTRHSRAFLRHLYNVKETTGYTLLSIHNLRFYQRLMSDMRSAILEGRAAAYRDQILATGM